MTLKLYGPLRSGTNYLAYLVGQSFGVRVLHNEGGWKHGPPMPTNADGYLLTIKEPLSWIASMRRYRNWPSLSWLISEWNRQAERIYSFSLRDDAVLVPYERLIRDKRTVLDQIGEAFGVRGKVLEIPNRMRRGGDEWCEPSSQPFDASYYLERRYLKEFAAHERDAIRAHTNEYLMMQLGYKW